jgi:serine/threonine protein kinase
MQKLEYFGSTSSFYRLRPGVVAKRPKAGCVDPGAEAECVRGIKIEHQILQHLGSHENIVPFVHLSHSLFSLTISQPLSIVNRYLGPSEESGFLLAEASHGSLQKFIDANTDRMDLPLRWKLVLQASNSIAFLHEKGVIHSDLRPANMLVHSKELLPSEQLIPSEDATLWLCDFGGSVCKKLKLDGGYLPDDPFFDPRQPWKSTPATDIFSLGSIFYTIMTGCWPYWQGPAPQGEERMAYQVKVSGYFKEGLFLDVTNVSDGKVIMGCWEYKYGTAKEVVNAVKAEMVALGIQ